MRIARPITVLAILAACHRPADSDEIRSSQKDLPATAPRSAAAANEMTDVAGMPLQAQRGMTGAAGGFTRAGNRIVATDASSAGNAADAAMIVRTGTASIEVSRLDPAIETLREIAQRAGGYVGTTSVQAGHDRSPAATLELRVPSAQFDELVTGLRPLGQVEYVNVSAEEVGEEFVDITARAANARRLEERLVNILATRTGKLSDVLQVERELARVREEIERYEGRLRYLKARSAVSTLAVTVHEPRPIVGEPGQNPVAEAVRAAWRNAVGVVAAGIAGAGYLAPLALLGAMAIFLLRRNRLRSPNAR